MNNRLWLELVYFYFLLCHFSIKILIYANATYKSGRWTQRHRGGKSTGETKNINDGKPWQWTIVINIISFTCDGLLTWKVINSDMKWEKYHYEMQIMLKKGDILNNNCYHQTEMNYKKVYLYI